MDVDMTQDGSPSLDTSEDSNQTAQQPFEQGQAPTIQELEKFERFKFQGQEWTPKDLERAMLRQQDYTKKTQSLAEERKSLDTERKYYENLNADLSMVRQNPNLASEFIKLYPQKFHQALKQVLSESQGQAQTQQVTQQPKYDVELNSRLSTLEKFYHEQDIAKNKAVVEAKVGELSKKYPDAIPEMVLGRIFESYSQLKDQDPEAKISDQTWEDTFKSVDQQMKEYASKRYGAMVKKQTVANEKAKAPDSGGGSVGRAPAKFKNLNEVTEYAIRDLTGRNS